MIHRFTQASDSDKYLAGSRQESNRSDIEQRATPLQIHDPESRDMTMANRLARELVNISGAEVIIYPRTENEAYDDVWEEDADPTYKAGKRIKGFFVPQPIAAALTQWGIDIENKTTVVFAREEIFETFGKRMIREGDIIELPYNASLRQLGRYRVLNAFDSGNYRYNWLYYSCNVENITGDKILDVDHK